MTQTHGTPDESSGDSHGGYTPLEAYGAIGNLETVALIGVDGAIDWCCFPDLESPSLFASILETTRGGHCTIAPTLAHQSTQAYLDRTNVLQTQFQTARGRATVTDFMAIPGDTAPSDHRALYRRVTADDGEIPFVIEFEPRFDYARTVPTVRRTDHGVAAQSDDEIAYLSSSVPFDVSDGGASASFTVADGETCWFVLGYEREIAARASDHRDQLDRVVDYWRDWCHSCEDDAACPVGGPWHDLAVRSELLLQLLTHRDTGAIAAAPTTSLPEDLGGVRNWDYRYNWIRDSVFTVQALGELDHLEEARDYFEMCLTHCAQGTPAEMQPVYGLHGRTDLEERTLDHLSGYRGSTPVRVGNEAARQRQLDVYGELVVGVHEMEQRGVDLLPDHWPLIRDIADHVCDVWRGPDVGIWEVRSGPEHFVYSKVMCWAVLDRAVRIAEDEAVDGDVERWRTQRTAIRETVLERGFNDALGSFVRSFENRDQLDAATLRLPLVDFLPADDPRIQGTIDTVMDRLLSTEGFLTRLEGDDGLPGDEGAFIVCSFWLISVLADAGRVEEATAIFAQVSQFVSPAGLLAEEIDPATGRHLGNTPQAFSHLGLINGLISLTEAGTTVDSPRDAATSTLHEIVDEQNT